MTKKELQKRLKIAVQQQRTHLEAGRDKRAAGYDRLIKETTRRLLGK